MDDVFDDRPCELGEGAFWHPERQQFFWFDILGKRLLSRKNGRSFDWTFDEHVSAAGWLSYDELLIAGESGLWRFDVETSRRERVATLPTTPHLRSNDGRADPWGGFWIGTMGKRSEECAGTIWRYYCGEMRPLYPSISITNAICFDALRSRAYFADTRLKTIWWVKLAEKDGWPVGDPTVFVDLSRQGFNPDGAVVDADGNVWNAQWGAGRVACYAPDGREIRAEHFAAARLSCPAFGGPNLDQLFVTSAYQYMNAEARLAEPCAGMSFVRSIGARGLREFQVVL